jgi:hypothetical protein
MDRFRLVLVLDGGAVAAGHAPAGAETNPKLTLYLEGPIRTARASRPSRRVDIYRLPAR